MELSIVIPTRNRAEKLNNLLRSISSQKYSKELYEVIVIDNGSTDNTRNVCKEAFHSILPNLRYIYDSRPGLHVGRNRGIFASKSEIVAYLDDDVILFPEWIDTILYAFTDSKTMAVCGSVMPHDINGLPDYVKSKLIKYSRYNCLWCVSCFWEDHLAENDDRFHRIDPTIIVGANCAFRKEVLVACNGFHPDGMPQHLLMYRGDGECHVGRYLSDHRMKCMYYAQASVYHILDSERLTLDYIDYMYFRNGISQAYTVLRKNGLKKAIEDITRRVYLFVINKEHESKPFIKGECYLVLYYIFYKRIREWVHKENYF